MKTNTENLPVKGLRKYLANLLRYQRAAIRKAPCSSPIELIRKEKLEAKLQQTRFLARDIAYFSLYPETLA